ALLSAAVLRSFRLLVDVLARVVFDSPIPCFLHRRGCSTGTSQIGHAVKAGQTLLRIYGMGRIHQWAKLVLAIIMASTWCLAQGLRGQTGEERMIAEGAPGHAGGRLV